MASKFLKLFLFFCSVLCSEERKSVAVCIPAVHATDESVRSLIESGRRYFCRLHEVDYFILSDETFEMDGDDVNWLAAGHNVPFKLFNALQGHKQIFDDYHFLFIISPKMVFVAPVGNEIFGELIAVRKENTVFSSSFYGGHPGAVFDLLKGRLSHHDDRLSDEALLNRCFKSKPPTRILSPSYAYPENWNLEYSKKIIER